MPKRLSEQEEKKRKKIRAEIEKLRKSKKRMLIRDMAKKLGLSYIEAFVYAKGFKSVTEYQNDLAKRKHGLTLGRYRRYKELEKDCKEIILGLAKDLSLVGYGIKRLKEEKGTLAIKLAEEDEEFDKNEVENNFKESLRKYSEVCSQVRGTKENRDEFEVFYEKNTVLIKVKNPNHLGSRAKLSVYGMSLEREVVK